MNLKILFLYVVYRPSDGDVDVCEFYFKNILFKDNVVNKNISLMGDFNINLLHFEQNKKVQNFINLMFQFGLVPTTNKPTRITKDTISAIITNSVINNKFKTAISTADISYHFPIIYAFKLKTNLDTLRLSFYINVLLTKA